MRSPPAASRLGQRAREGRSSPSSRMHQSRAELKCPPYGTSRAVTSCQAFPGATPAGRECHLATAQHPRSCECTRVHPTGQTLLGQARRHVDPSPGTCCPAAPRGASGRGPVTRPSACLPLALGTIGTPETAVEVALRRGARTSFGWRLTADAMGQTDARFARQVQSVFCRHQQLALVYRSDGPWARRECGICRLQSDRPEHCAASLRG